MADPLSRIPESLAMTLGGRSGRLRPSSRPYHARDDQSSSPVANPLSLTARIAEGYSEDANFSDQQAKYRFEYRNGLWFHGNQLVVPGPILRREVIERAHDSS